MKDTAHMVVLDDELMDAISILKEEAESPTGEKVEKVDAPDTAAVGIASNGAGSGIEVAKPDSEEGHKGQAIESHRDYLEKLANDPHQKPMESDPFNLDVQKLYRRAVEYRLAHGFFQRKMSYWNDVSSFTVLTLSTITGLLLFWGPIFSEVCAGLTIVITAINTISRKIDFSGRSEQHELSRKVLILTLSHWPCCIGAMSASPFACLHPF